VYRDDQDDHTARNLALVGGGALLVWLLVSGGGGLGLGGSGGGTASAAPAPPPTPAPPPPPCKVRIDILGVHVDGKPVDVKTAIERCRASKRAEVVVTGDARQGTKDDVMRSFAAAGIAVATNSP